MGGPADLQYARRSDYIEWLRPRVVDADVVHAHMFGSWWAASRAVPGLVPLVASEHNAFLWPGDPPVAEMRRALRRVDFFFAHGAAAYETVLEHGMPAARTRRAEAPIDGLDVSPLRELPSPRIVYAGRLNWDKGVDVLVDALALVPACPPAFLLGSGPIEQVLRSRAEELGLGGIVHFVGWQDQPGAWLRGASVCVVPSRHEAWSQTGVLAMALGVPVVGTSVEGMPEILGGGRGVMVPSDDPPALASAIDDVLSGRVVTDRAAGASYARGFTAERVAAAYAAGYEAATQHRAAVVAEGGR